ncbi:DUF6773 family protein [Alkalicoccus luteus]|uniref:DUF6773 family protein n=1 Tax=Alkalicoccus luteus TaxID=1237094 RepID=UPI004034A4C7
MVSLTRQKDERVVGLENKVYRELMYIVYALLLASLIYNYVQFGAQEAFLSIEVALLLLLSLYSGIRYQMMGLYTDKAEEYLVKKKKKYSTFYFVAGGLLGLGFSFSFAFNSAINYAETTTQSITYFATVFFVCAIIYIVPLALLTGFMPWISERKAKKRLQEDEGES